MGKPQGPPGRVPFSRGVKIAVAFIALSGIVWAVYEYVSLQSTDPDSAAPISWAWWWLYESTGSWFAILFGGVGGAFYSHFLWFRRANNFWAPITRTSAIVMLVGTIVTFSVVKAWALLLFFLVFQGAAVLAHRYWYRLERFNEHLARFHDE